MFVYKLLYYTQDRSHEVFVYRLQYYTLDRSHGVFVYILAYRNTHRIIVMKHLWETTKCMPR
jgi:hypothetical protein